MIDPDHLRTNEVAPPVYITEATVNGIRVDVSPSPVVKPGKGELVFRFGRVFESRVTPAGRRNVRIHVPGLPQEI